MKKSWWAAPLLLIGGPAVVFGPSLIVSAWYKFFPQEHDRPSNRVEVAFSPSHKGERIVFSAPGQGGRDLYLYDQQNFHLTRLTRTDDYENDPSFSPDDKSVLYVAGTPQDSADHIFLRSLSNGKVRQLTHDAKNDREPAFSPDGSHIVFVRDEIYSPGGLASPWHNENLYMMNVDGSHLQRLTTPVLPAIEYPQFMPDGKSIIFTAIGQSTSQRLADGSFEVPMYLCQSFIDKAPLPAKILTLTPDGTTSYATLAPDGQHILIVSYSGSFRLMKFNNLAAPVTTDQEIYHDRSAAKPRFATDGKTILYLSGYRRDDQDKYLVVQITPGSQSPQTIGGRDLLTDPAHWK